MGRNRARCSRTMMRRALGIITLLFWSNVVHAQDSETPPDGQPPGSTGPEIVVNGIRQPAARLFDAFIPNIPFVAGQFVFADEPQGPVRNQHQCTRKNALREAGTDQTAVDIEQKIKVQLDYSSREYGSAVIGNFQDSDNPSFRNADLSRGETWAEARAAHRDVPRTIISIPALGTFERIVAVVHSHPSVGVPDYQLNFLPSDNDWQVYRLLQNQYPSTKLVPEYAFSHYIVGPDGKMRQYRQDAGQPTRPTSGIQNRC